MTGQGVTNPGRWSRDWDCCQTCGTIETKHHTRGVCHRCYFWWKYHNDEGFRQKELVRVKRWSMDNVDHCIARTDRWRKANPKKAVAHRREYKRRQAVVELKGLGVKGCRIGTNKFLHGERVWTFRLEDGTILKEVPDAIMVRSE